MYDDTIPTFSSCGSEREGGKSIDVINQNGDKIMLNTSSLVGVIHDIRILFTERALSPK